MYERNLYFVKKNITILWDFVTLYPFGEPLEEDADQVPGYKDADTEEKLRYRENLAGRTNLDDRTMAQIKHGLIIE